MAGALAACTSSTEEVAETTEPRGTSFTSALARDYRSFTDFEANRMYDWTDAEHFAEKTLRAQAGEVVAPESLEERDLPKGTVEELRDARARLVTVVESDAQQRLPKLLARAQSQFDCWVEQQEENHQPLHIALCRDGFYDAMAAIDTRVAARTTANAPVTTPATPVKAIVYFEFDSAALSSEATTQLQQALQAARSEGAEFFVTGHADRAGPADYNMNLSLRRAKAVEEVLMGSGVTADKIGVAARGESDTAVPTEDGVRMPMNRRVEIIMD